LGKLSDIGAYASGKCFRLPASKRDEKGAQFCSIMVVA
jgi:hypothetical protein